MLIVGNGPEYKNLLNLVHELNLRNVHFLGSLTQDILAKHLRKSYALILPTITMEGHPKVIIEAFSSGVPCIATDVPGSREIIKNNENGIIVKRGDFNELAKAIMIIINNVSFRTQISKKAFIDSKEYSIKSVMMKEIQIIDSFP